MQSSFMRPDDYWIDTGKSAKAALAKATEGLSGKLEGVGVSNLSEPCAAFFKDTEDVSCLPDVEAGQGKHFIYYAHCALHLGSDFDRAFQS